jgi:hypothetical protein
LYEEIIIKAKEANLAGATATKRIIGFGHHKQIHSSKLLDFSENLPIIIEIIDHKSKIEKFLDLIKPYQITGLIVLENIKIIQL